MSTTPQSPTPGARDGYWASFRRMPLVLQAYAGFAVIACVVWLTSTGLLFLPGAARYLAPLNLGMALSAYIFTLYFAFSMPLQPHPRAMTLALVPMVSIALFSGIFDVARLRSDTLVAAIARANSPFMDFSPWRPVISIAMPLYWILLLLSPSVWRWNAAKNHGRGSQFALLDLFYLVLVIAICTGLSLALMAYVRGRLEAGANSPLRNAPPTAQSPKTP